MEYNKEPSINKDDLKRSGGLKNYRYNPYSRNVTDKTGEFNKHNNLILTLAELNDLKSEYERNNVLSTGEMVFNYNDLSPRWNPISQSSSQSLKLINQAVESSTSSEYINSSSGYEYNPQFSNFLQTDDEFKTPTTTDSYDDNINLLLVPTDVQKYNKCTTTTTSKTDPEITSTFDYRYNHLSSNLSDITGECNIDEIETLAHLSNLESEHECNKVSSTTGKLVDNHNDLSPKTPINQSSICQLLNQTPGSATIPVYNSSLSQFSEFSQTVESTIPFGDCFDVPTHVVQKYKRFTDTTANASKTVLELTTPETYNASKENYSYLNVTDAKYAVYELFERSDKFYKAIVNSQLLESMESIKNKRINMISYFTRNAETIFECAPQRYDNNVIFLATYIADFYLMTNEIDMELSLLEEVAWRLACKYESRAARFNYTKHNRAIVNKIEREIFEVFHFDVNVPHPLGILNAFVKCADVPQEVYMMTQCILEIILRNFKHIICETKRVAASAFYYSLKFLVPERATMLLKACTDYNPSELIYDAEFIHENIRTAVTVAPDVIIKYRRPEYLEISKQLYVKL